MHSPSIPRCWVEIDGAALRHNLRAIRRQISRSTALLAIVKANAYGHGVGRISRECERQGVAWFGVANLAEALELRALHVREAILLLSAVLPAEMPKVIENGFTAAVSSLDEARLWSAAAKRLSVPAKLHFKVDVGMGRLGLWHEEAIEQIKAARELPRVIIEGIFTHFPCADDDEVMTRSQWTKFERVRREFPDLLCHAANSPAVFAAIPPRGQSDMVRAGIALYGAGPTPGSESKVRPILSWKSRITHINQVPAGRTISYGATYRLRRTERHAVVAAGYADGYHRALSNRACVLIGGRRCPVRGRVTMDQIVVDVTALKRVRLGDEVVLIGKQGREEITANEMARWADTISYEIFTSIGPRVVRKYRGFKP